ncbi:MAG: hypothetical protein AAGC60_04760 [Acidobacteriota bacterium]
MGKVAEAVGWAQEIADHLHGSEIAGTVHVFHEVLDEVGAIYWHADYDNVAEVEEARRRLLRDEKYQGLIADSGQFLVEGTLEDTLLAPV